MRGGISVGHLYHDPKYLFGPAFIKAYDLESKIAKTPRIINEISYWLSKTNKNILVTYDISTIYKFLLGLFTRISAESLLRVHHKRGKNWLCLKRFSGHGTLRAKKDGAK